MSVLYEQLRQKIFGAHQPYAGFPAKEWGGVWYNDGGACRDIFKEAIDIACPGIIVEVGSFVGESTIFMAKHLKATGRDAVILAVDTWGGGIDHWQHVPEKLRFWFGRPSLFYQFMGNVIQHGVPDMILPIALDSITGARLLKLLKITPNMVYVDAGHEEGDALRDMEAYWPLLPKGGVMLNDDVNNIFPGVLHDWTNFVAANQLTPRKIVAEKTMLVKP